MANKTRTDICLPVSPGTNDIDHAQYSIVTFTSQSYSFMFQISAPIPQHLVSYHASLVHIFFHPPLSTSLSLAAVTMLPLTTIDHIKTTFSRTLFLQPQQSHFASQINSASELNINPPRPLHIYTAQHPPRVTRQRILPRWIRIHIQTRTSTRQGLVSLSMQKANTSRTIQSTRSQSSSRRNCPANSVNGFTTRNPRTSTNPIAPLTPNTTISSPKTTTTSNPNASLPPPSLLPNQKTSST